MHRLLSGKLIVYILFLLILDLCFMPLLRIGWARPVLSYLLIAYAALVWRLPSTWFLALVVGFGRDLLGVHPLGVETAALLAGSYALDFAVHKIERKSLLLQAAVIFSYVFFVNLSNLCLLLILKPDGTPLLYPLVLSYKTAFYTMCAAPFFFYFTSKWFGNVPVTKQYDMFDRLSI